MARDVIQGEVLPDLDHAIDVFIQWRETPKDILFGLTPGQLLRSIEPDRTWFVGSSVWYPLVVGLPAPDDADIDIVMYKEEFAVECFAEMREMIEGRDPERFTINNDPLNLRGWKVEENHYGGQKLRRGQQKILDCWSLTNNHSIAEHIMTFPQDHEHCAISATIGKGDVSGVTRLVRFSRHVSAAKWDWNSYIKIKTGPTPVLAGLFGPMQSAPAQPITPPTVNVSQLLGIIPTASSSYDGS